MGRMKRLELMIGVLMVMALTQVARGEQRRALSLTFAWYSRFKA